MNTQAIYIHSIWFSSRVIHDRVVGVIVSHSIVSLLDVVTRCKKTIAMICIMEWSLILRILVIIIIIIIIIEKTKL